ncbi:HD domain-containing protein, putative [Eimeria tenella]|uniref:HD domain-containing protein, putative n=1 Tax=Eimeria tenella TaxID=5802 RepID=U6L6Z2_EIMTE|nr:HD domain-containing protein, putative [Eimeria tenella]CDJ43555.1 HD domain-containing protein, putative [Eimeria tenella]|eukprot:XP_013234305.1 HD domain-containing protein, putative [Eimeria tenella]
MSGEERKGLESFLSFGGKLKKLKRAGWLRYVHPSDVESVADHSFGVAFHFLGLPDSDLVVNGQLADRNKCAAMALAHDLAESVVGDITPLDGISEKEKREKEKNAFLFICKFLDDKRAKEVRELWEEYERGDSLLFHSSCNFSSFETFKFSSF